MKLVPVSVEEMAEIKRPYSNNYALLMEFLNSEHDCMKVVNSIQKSSDICANSLRISIKKFGLNSITAIKRGENVYLIKK